MDQAIINLYDEYTHIKLSCVGFCWSGAMANNLAVNVPNLRGTVAYYGRPPEPVEVPKLSLRSNYIMAD